jgi:hypothetical protein
VWTQFSRPKALAIVGCRVFCDSLCRGQRRATRSERRCCELCCQHSPYGPVADSAFKCVVRSACVHSASLCALRRGRRKQLGYKRFTGCDGFSFIRACCSSWLNAHCLTGCPCYVCALTTPHCLGSLTVPQQPTCKQRRCCHQTTPLQRLAWGLPVSKIASNQRPRQANSNTPHQHGRECHRDFDRYALGLKDGQQGL